MKVAEATPIVARGNSQPLALIDKPCICKVDEKIPVKTFFFTSHLFHGSFKLILWLFGFLQKPFRSVWDSGKIDRAWDSLFSIFTFFQPNKVHSFSILWKTCLVSPSYVVLGSKVMLSQSDLHCTLWNFKCQVCLIFKF